MDSDYYDLLGVPRDADAAAIKSAYRKAALANHPDRNPGDPQAEERFKAIAEAYAVLSDPDKRARYDRFGTAEPGPTAQGGDIFDLFNSVFGGGGFGFDPRQARETGQPGEDLEAHVDITLEQAREGATVPVTIERMARCERCDGDRAEPGTNGKSSCPTCGGAGQVRQQAQSLFGTVMTTRTCPRCYGAGVVVTNPCTGCSGRGRSLAKNTVDVTLPKGIDGGYRLRIPRQGNAGVDGGATGDLYVHLTVEPHPHFVRDGDDVRYVLAVGPAQATLGGRFEIPTFDGADTFDLPAGTQPGEEFRLRGKGMPRLRRSGSGDQIVVVQVVIPRDLPKSARELLLAYADEAGEPVHVEPGLLDRIKDATLGRGRKGKRKS